MANDPDILGGKHLPAGLKHISEGDSRLRQEAWLGLFSKGLLHFHGTER
jgi:hypothetical protein